MMDGATSGCPPVWAENRRQSVDGAVEMKTRNQSPVRAYPPAKAPLNLLKRAELSKEVRNDHDVDEHAKHLVIAIAQPTPQAPGGGARKAVRSGERATSSSPART